MQKLKISSKNQVVIPKDVRTKMHVAGGDRLVVHKLTHEYVVLKREPSYHDFLGIAQPGTDDPVQRVRELRDNWR